MLEPQRQGEPRGGDGEGRPGPSEPVRTSLVGRWFGGRARPETPGAASGAAPYRAQVRPSEPSDAPEPSDVPQHGTPQGVPEREQGTVGPERGSSMASTPAAERHGNRGRDREPSLESSSPRPERPPEGEAPPQPEYVEARGLERAAEGAKGPAAKELGERVQSGFQDLSRLLGAIKETLQGREGQVQQTLQALPDFLQQVPRIHRAEIDCLAQISKQLEHMGSGTRDVVSRLDGLPDLLRSLALSQAEQGKFLENLQANLAETLETQSKAIREGLETNRRSAETQLQLIRSIASTQEDIFSTFQNTQNRALNVFHRAQQQSIAQSRDTQKVMNRQIETLVEKVHSAQTRVFWLSIGFAALAAAGLLAVVFLG